MRIAKFNKLYILVLITILNACGSSEKITKSTKIEVEGDKRFNYDREVNYSKTQKKSFNYYIVYSDRIKNKVYNDSYAQERLKDAEFRKAYYVIDKKNGFSELVEFAPELVGKPEGFFSVLRSKKRHFIDAKEVKYTGWINSKNLLKFDHSYLNPSNYQPTRYILGISSLNSLVNIPDFIKDNEVYLYQDPTLTTKSDQSLELSQIVYIFKYNQEKTSALISNKHKLIQEENKEGEDSEEQVLGWVPVEMLKRIGQKQVFLWDNEDTLNFKRLEYDSIYSLGSNSIYSPVLFNREDHKKEAYSIKTRAPINMITPVWDHSDNKLISLNGNKITEELRNRIDKENKVFNLNFIFDCSASLKEDEAQLIGSLQKLKVLIGEKGLDNYKINYAVSSYGCSGSYDLKRTSSFSEWINYIQDIFEGKAPRETETDSSITDSFYNVLGGDNQSFENNIMIVVGSKKYKLTGKEKYKDLIKKLTTNSSRIVFFQIDSGVEEDYQNFILQSKILLANVANHYTEYIKGYNVDYNLIKPDNTFSNLEGNGNTFIFDSPKNSSYQGAIVFPSIDERSTPQDFDIVVDSLITKTIEFNALSKKSRDHFAKDFSFSRSKPRPFIKELLSFNENIQPYKNNPDELFNVDLDIIVDSTSINKIKEGYLLDKGDLEIVIDKYRSLVPLYDHTITKRERKKLYKLYRDNRKFFNQFVLNNKISKDGTLADLIYAKTGTPIFDNQLEKIQIRSIKKDKKMSSLQLTDILSNLRKKIDVLESKLNNIGEPYKYGGTDVNYYFIPKELTL